MTTPSGSYRQVFYDLRPAKQVERRMIIDVLQRLAAGGFQLRDYQYTGLGSVYFVDFVLLHRLLGIRKLLSVEFDQSITKRVDFNRPFSVVDIKMSAVGDVIPTLDKDLKHILWLDYDSQLDRSIVTDVALAGYHLSVGSILLVTIDLKPPALREGPNEWMEYYAEQARMYFGSGWTREQFSLSALPRTVAEIVFNAIRNGIAGRPSVKFLPLMSFKYADGHPMLTVGGILGTEEEERGLAGCDWGDLAFMRRDAGSEPYEIVVPRLTRKERIYLDRHMPCPDQWTPAEFELSEEEAMNYRSVYRYYPIYGELLF